MRLKYHYQIPLIVCEDMETVEQIICNSHIETAHVRFFKSDRSLLGVAEMLSGSVNSISISLRAVAKVALQLDAQSITLTHHHPSGDPAPSRADRVETRKLIQGLKMLDITVYDHIITSTETSFSFRAAGLI